MKSSVVLILIIAIIALIISIVAINNSQTSSLGENTLSRVLKTRVIEACTVINPPTTIKDAQTGALSGHMVDAMDLVAKKLNAKVSWHESTWGNASADLQSKRCDVIVAPFFANIERAQAVAFTKPPLLYMGHSALVRKNDARFINVKNVFDFDQSNIKVVVATGEVGDIFVTENFSKAQITKIDTEASDLTRFALEVSAGRADVAIAGSDTTAIFAAAHPEITDLFKNNPFGLAPVGWATRQDDLQWKDFLETSLQFLDTQGTLLKLEKQYDANWLHLIKDYQFK